MITNPGREIIGKYLLGQTSSFASHLAIGCGAVVLQGQGENQPDTDKERTELEFEMARVPIIAKGFISDVVDGEPVTKLILKAELPTEQRFKITEVGIYPAANNPRAGSSDSKVLANFLPTESWSYIYSNGSVETIGQDVTISSDGSTIDFNTAGVNPVDSAYIDDENSLWENPRRQERIESPRFYNKSIIVAGDVGVVPADFNVSGNGIQNNNIRLDLSSNSPTDKIKIAMSIVPANPINNVKPDAVRFVVDFLNISESTTYARWKGTYDINGDSYQIVSGTKSDFILSSSTFSWANINGVRIYASTYKSTTPDDDWFIIYDGLRLDNVSSVNPLYGLVGYNVIRTDSGYPIVKRANSQNYVEYRFDIGVI